MRDLANSVLEKIKDYRNSDGIQVTVESILKWAEQFGKDAEFMLTEINHILPQTYIPLEIARNWIKSHIETMLSDSNYGSITEFLSETEFLDMQPIGKSQNVILELVDEVLVAEYQHSFKDYVTFPKTNFVYFDDVLASGGTIGGQVIYWLKLKNDGRNENHLRISKDEFRLSIHLFCLHTWGHSFQKIRISKTFSQALERKIKWYRNFEIQNHIKFHGEELNIAIPVKDQPNNAKTYLANLNAEKYEDYAYRPDNLPAKESFFTSPENRIKYEGILLQKGLLIIDMIQGPVSPNIRPLGFINPNYKTYGLGTHFFTWRNIPNNAPLALWWDVPGHDWHPLFPARRRN